MAIIIGFCAYRISFCTVSVAIVPVCWPIRRMATIIGFYCACRISFCTVSVAIVSVCVPLRSIFIPRISDLLPEMLCCGICKSPDQTQNNHLFHLTLSNRIWIYNGFAKSNLNLFFELLILKTKVI